MLLNKVFSKFLNYDGWVEENYFGFTTMLANILN